ncbi:19469_t:CDS:1, partial [Funneliformis geosporum]
ATYIKHTTSLLVDKPSINNNKNKLDIQRKSKKSLRLTFLKVNTSSFLNLSGINSSGFFEYFDE